MTNFESAERIDSHKYNLGLLKLIALRQSVTTYGEGHFKVKFLFPAIPYLNYLSNAPILFFQSGLFISFSWVRNLYTKGFFLS